jgi:HD superfamily phosphohydrolase
VSATASFRDPIHGFIKADALETALINSQPIQRLRWIRQLGMAYLVFPGAEHSRFSHVLGVMHLAGRVYDAVAAASDGLLELGAGSRDRRLVRAAALLHDIGHPPFSHSAEELFEEPIHHEEMTCRLLALDEIAEIFHSLGDGLTGDDVARVLTGPRDSKESLLSQIVSGELDVDKMDYLRRDTLYTGVRYGSYDLDRLLHTMLPLEDPTTSDWGLGVDEGGVHALEGLVMARYYMFSQVYFNVTSKAYELHLSKWLEDEGLRWPIEAEAFLAHDDVTTWARMRASRSRHGQAVVRRRAFPLAFQTDEHLSTEEKQRFEALLPAIEERFGASNLMISHSSKDPHRLQEARVFTRRFDGTLVPMAEASHFIGHLTPINRFRVYAAHDVVEQVGAALRAEWA